MASATPGNQSNRIQFYVTSISCIACTPVFKRSLQHTEGIRDVRELPMFNKIVVEFDPAETNENRVRGEIHRIAEKAGYKGRVVISR